MATTFDVIPSTNLNITFGEIVKPSERNINQYLSDIGAKDRIKLKAEIFSNDSAREATPDEPFMWPQTSNAWLTIGGVPGGTDVHCHPINNDYGNFSENSWLLLTELNTAPNHQPSFNRIIESARYHNHSWSLRRSAGQRPITNLSYGIIAATLAELTDGLIFSDDNAWDYNKVPTTGSVFLSEYFQPSANINKEHADWAASNVSSIIEGIFD